MTPTARAARNTTMLNQCHPYLHTRLSRVLHALEQESFAPRIQCAWRSSAEQLAAYQRGTSKLKFGFHNCCTPDGKPDALACDILDDDHPLQPHPVYLVRLAWHAEQHGLITGIRWGLPAPLVKAVDLAIQHSQYGDALPPRLKIGFDPTHCEVAGLTVAEARRGVRPETGGMV
jgi:hypothetical protein